MANVQVVLIVDVAKYGKKGDVISVSSGFANYLISQKKAEYATAASIKKAKQEKQKKQIAKQQQKQKVQNILNQINKELTIKAKANEQGHLFESVTAKKIEQILKKQFKDSPIKQSHIKISEPFKTIGSHTFDIVFDDIKQTIALKIEEN